MAVNNDGTTGDNIRYTEQHIANMSYDQRMALAKVLLMGYDDTEGAEGTRRVAINPEGQIEVDIKTMPSISIDTSLLAKESKQLPDNHQVTVSNPTANPETGLATSAKQDTLLTELKLKANLTEEQPVYDEGNNNALTRILEQVTQPLYYDAAQNRLMVNANGTVAIASMPNVGINAMGGLSATEVATGAINQVWASTVRSLLI